MGSGFYTFNVTDVADGNNTIAFTITDQYGNTVVTSNDWAVAATLADANSLELGLTVSITTASLATGSFDFEYIAQGQAKMEMREMSSAGSTATGTLVAVDANGADGPNNATNTFFYGSAGTTYDTGIGLKIDLAAFANIATGSAQYTQFTYSDEAMDVDVSTAGKATDYMATLDTAIQTVSTSLNSVGSLVARLDAKEEAVGVAQVNTEAAYNRVVNADMALEQVEASKYLILQQTAVAMLAQANMAPQGILSLFR